MNYNRELQEQDEALRLEFQASVAGIERGLKDIAEGRLITLEDFVAEMSGRLLRRDEIG